MNDKARQNEIKALRKEAAGYIRVGMIDKAEAVNVELKARGADTVPVPAEPRARKATSPAAATRRKRKASE